MRLRLSGIVGGALALSWATAAHAQDLYFKCSTQVSNGAVTTVYSSGVFRAPIAMYAAREYAQAFKQFLISQGIAAPYANCSTNDTIEKSFKWLDYSEEHALKMKGRFAIVPWAPAGGEVIARGSKEPGPASKPSRSAESTPARTDTNSAREAEEARARARAERDAEWQRKVAEHEAGVAEYQRKVAAREAEIARQQREHDAAQDEAQKAMAAHEAKMEAHRSKLAKAERAREEWLAVKRRHDRCIGGDQQACRDMAAGKPAAPEQLADAGEARTSDDDARTCVTEPVVSPSKTFKGQIQAVVFNGCRTAVDVRICLLRTGGWNCGVTWGLQPQDRWSHTTFESKGGVFWDARPAGTNRPLASPGD